MADEDIMEFVKNQLILPVKVQFQQPFIGFIPQKLALFKKSDSLFVSSETVKLLCNMCLKMVVEISDQD